MAAKTVENKVNLVWKNICLQSKHRRTSQGGAGGGGTAPLVSEIFGQNAQNSGNEETIIND